MNMEKNNVNSLRIISDMPSLDDHLKFNSYSQILAEIMLNSDPRFTVGIFGGWGTIMNDYIDENDSEKSFEK